MTGLSLQTYYEEISTLLVSDDLFAKLELAKIHILDAVNKGGRLLLAGNGASASIVSHAAVDFTKQAKVTSLTFNDAALITAFANDYGYENWVSKAVEKFGQPEDILICVSVSGESSNLVNAIKTAKKRGNFIITFSGTTRNNRLFNSGDLNFFVDSAAYNIVEGIHMLWLTSIVDLIIDRSRYDVKSF